MITVLIITHKGVILKLSMDREGFIEDCIEKNDVRSILVFLLDSLPNSIVRLNKVKKCVEIYPNLPEVDEDEE